VAAIGLEHLRCEVVGRAANCTLLFALVEDLGCKTEVTDLETHTIGQEEVAQLQVAVDDFARVHILHCFDQLVDVVASFDFMQALAALDKVGKRLVGANIEHDVHVLFVFEVAVEAHHILVIERAMNLDLTRQLLTGLGSREVSFGDHFESPCQILVIFSLDRVDSAHFVALGEASFSKEAPTLVANKLARFFSVFRVQWLHFLLDSLYKSNKT